MAGGMGLGVSVVIAGISYKPFTVKYADGATES